MVSLAVRYPHVNFIYIGYNLDVVGTLKEMIKDQKVPRMKKTVRWMWRKRNEQTYFGLTSGKLVLILLSLKSP